MIPVEVWFGAGICLGWLLGLWRCRIVVRRAVAEVRKPLVAARVVERHLQPEMNRRDRRAAARRAAKR